MTQSPFLGKGMRVNDRMTIKAKFGFGYFVTFEWFKGFKNKVENQFNKRIIALRLDRSG